VVDAIQSKYYHHQHQQASLTNKALHTKSFTYTNKQTITIHFFSSSKQTTQTTFKMFIDDLAYIRAHLSTGKKAHAKIFSPSSSATSSAAPTPDNRSIASTEKKNKKRFSLFSSKPATSTGGIVLTKDHSLHYQQVRPMIH
jgi:hypothetical protein